MNPSNPVSWLDTPVKIKKGKSNRTKNAPAVLYPNFAAAAMMTDDQFWVSLLNNASLGKFPRGYSCRDPYLYYRKGTRSVKIEISEDPNVLLEQVVSFMRDTTGMRSDRDLEFERQITENEAQHDKPLIECSWSEIKKKGYSEIVMNEYINLLTSKYSLTEEEKNGLITVLTLGLILGDYTSSCIQVEDGKIVGIRGLVFNNESRIFTFNSTRSNKNLKNIKLPKYSADDLKQIIIKSKTPDLLEIWRSYCRSRHESSTSSSTTRSIRKKTSSSSEYIEDSQEL